MIITMIFSLRHSLFFFLLLIFSFEAVQGQEEFTISLESTSRGSINVLLKDSTFTIDQLVLEYEIEFEGCETRLSLTKVTAWEGGNEIGGKIETTSATETGFSKSFAGVFQFFSTFKKDLPGNYFTHFLYAIAPIRPTDERLIAQLFTSNPLDVKRFQQINGKPPACPDLQNTPNVPWTHIRLGHDISSIASASTLRKVGCEISSVAMILKFLGIEKIVLKERDYWPGYEPIIGRGLQDIQLTVSTENSREWKVATTPAAVNEWAAAPILNNIDWENRVPDPDIENGTWSKISSDDPEYSYAPGWVRLPVGSIETHFRGFWGFVGGLGNSRDVDYQEISLIGKNEEGERVEWSFNKKGSGDNQEIIDAVCDGIPSILRVNAISKCNKNGGHAVVSTGVGKAPPAGLRGCDRNTECGERIDNEEEEIWIKDPSGLRAASLHHPRFLGKWARHRIPRLVGVNNKLLDSSIISVATSFDLDLVVTDCNGFITSEFTKEIQGSEYEDSPPIISSEDPELEFGGYKVIHLNMVDSCSFKVLVLAQENSQYSIFIRHLDTQTGLNKNSSTEHFIGQGQEHEFSVQVNELGNIDIEEIKVGIIFSRGDTNDDGKVDISDSINVLSFLFLGIGIISCEDASDSNDDGKLDITDGIEILSHLFLNTPQNLANPIDCGVDETNDSIDCKNYSSCLNI